MEQKKNMRLLTYLVSAKYINGQFLPNGMPIPPHLLASMEKETSDFIENSYDDGEALLPPSHLISNNDIYQSDQYYESNEYDTGNNYYDSYSNENNYYDGAGENLNTLDPEMLTFEQPQLSYDDFVFAEAPMPIDRSRAHYFDGMKMDQNVETIPLDLTVPPSNTDQLAKNTLSIHPERGTFNLEAALQQSRNNGYGSGVRLRFAGTSLSQVDPIYLCKERSGDQCCEDKNPECFTPGGCFCDSSCRAFDDCCPDFEDHCADKSCLENLRTDIVSTYLRNFRRKPENLKDLPSIASGGQPKHVEPNACCSGRPFNHGLRCCCSGSVTDECPCKTET